jgi:hypothetical protein
MYNLTSRTIVVLFLLYKLIFPQAAISIVYYLLQLSVKFCCPISKYYETDDYGICHQDVCMSMHFYYAYKLQVLYIIVKVCWPACVSVGNNNNGVFLNGTPGGRATTRVILYELVLV